MASTSKLVRSRGNRRIAGVAGGLSEFFGISSTLIRIGFVLFGVFGVGEIVYLILWLVLPKAPR